MGHHVNQPSPVYTRLEFISLVVTSFILAVTLVAVVAAPILAWQWTQLPFPGFMLEPTLHVASAVNSAWEGPQKGIAHPARLLTVDGQAVTSSAQLADLLRGHQVGQSLIFEFTQADGQHLTVPLTLVSFNAVSLAEFFIVPYLVGLIYLGAGVWVFRLRYQQAVGRVFVLMCCGIALMSCLYFEMSTTHRLAWAWGMSVPLAAGSIIALSMLFPQEQRLAERWQVLRWMPFIPSAAMMVYDLLTTYDMANSLAYVLAWRYGYLYGGLALVTFIGMMAYRRYASPSLVVRQQSQVILWGAFCAFFLIITYIARVAMFGSSSFIPWLYLPPLVLFPLAIGYAIMRYRILDIDLVISRSLTYAVLTGIIVGVYFLVINAISLGLRSTVTFDNPWVISMMILLVAVLLDPLRDKVQGALDYVFYRHQVDYGSSLRAFSEGLMDLVDQEQIIRTLFSHITDTMHPSAAWIYLYDSRIDGYLVQDMPGTTHPPTGATHFSAEGPLAQALATSRSPLIIRDGRSGPVALAEERARLDLLGATLFVPLHGRQSTPSSRRLIGWVALADKKSGQLYANSDTDFLLALADQVVLALDRTHIFADLERRIQELSALSLISQAVNFALESDDIFELIYTQTGRIIDASHTFYVALYDDKRNIMRFAFYIERGERLHPDEEWELGTGLTSEIVRTARPLVTNDYLAECEKYGVVPSVVAGTLQPYAWMGVPLLAGERVIGVMNVSSSDRDVIYTEENLQFFRSVADHTANILEKHQLYRQMEQRAMQLVTLNEIGRSISSSLDVKSTLNLVIEKAAEILDAEAASLFLIDSETDELVFEVALGPTSPELLGTRLPKGKGIVGKVVETLQPTIVNNVASDARHYKGYDKSGEFVTRALIAVPLITKDTPIGVIEVLNKRDGTPFDEDDLNLLQTFAAQSAAAIENARLYTRTDEALAVRLEELQTLQRIDRELNASLDVERALDLTVQWAMDITRATAGLIGIMLPDNAGLLFRAIHGFNGEAERYRTEPWPLNRGIMGRVAQMGFPNMVPDVSEDPDYVSFIPDVKSHLSVPVMRENRVIGVVVLESTQANDFTLEDLNFVVRLADHAATAIANSQLYEEVKRANEYKSEFVSIVAHELKLPMQNIKGYGDLLSKGLGGDLTDMQKQFLGVIRSNVDRMNTLVSDLLDVSRMETGRLRLDLKPTSLQEVAQEAVNNLKQRIEEKQQTIALEMPEALPPVLGDKGRLLQITINLISNAFKYTPTGGNIVVRLEEQVLNGRRDLVCAVKDDGVGIAPEDVARLGQKFFRAASVSSDHRVADSPGHGLGLSIVKNLIQLHGGQLMIESEVGKGSTFSFNVPVVDEPPPEAKSKESAIAL